MVVVVSGSGKTVVGRLEGMVVVIIGSGAGELIPSGLNRVSLLREPRHL